mmetsp:Transcript_44415/g.121033  ORF Transcript_44415/g.121033 Transcript_44415/m.121033 type:complete len:1055 (+) Transcript_44415:331-3495(+)
MSYRTREARVGSDDRYGAPPIPPTGSKGGRSGAGGYYDSDNYVTRAERERERSDHRERRTSLTDVEAPDFVFERPNLYERSFQNFVSCLFSVAFLPVMFIYTHVARLIFYVYFYLSTRLIMSASYRRVMVMPGDGYALVTGATNGLGECIARNLARRGYNVILVGRRAEKMEKLASTFKNFRNVTGRSIDVQWFVCDLSEPGAPTRLFNEIDAKRLDVSILVNNAGMRSNGAFVQQGMDELRAGLYLNNQALMELMHVFMKNMVSRSRGHILNVASIAAFSPGPMQAAFHASKAFVVSISRALDYEMRGTGVSVTVLCPGFSAFEFTKIAEKGLDGMFKHKTVVVGGYTPFYPFTNWVLTQAAPNMTEAHSGWLTERLCSTPVETPWRAQSSDPSRGENDIGPAAQADAEKATLRPNDKWGDKWTNSSGATAVSSYMDPRQKERDEQMKRDLERARERRGGGAAHNHHATTHQGAGLAGEDENDASNVSVGSVGRPRSNSRVVSSPDNATEIQVAEMSRRRSRDRERIRERIERQRSGDASDTSLDLDRNNSSLERRQRGNGEGVRPRSADRSADRSGESLERDKSNTSAERKRREKDSGRTRHRSKETQPASKDAHAHIDTDEPSSPNTESMGRSVSGGSKKKSGRDRKKKSGAGEPDEREKDSERPSSRDRDKDRGSEGDGESDRANTSLERRRKEREKDGREGRRKKTPPEGSSREDESESGHNSPNERRHDSAMEVVSPASTVYSNATPTAGGNIAGETHISPPGPTTLSRGNVKVQQEDEDDEVGHEPPSLTLPGPAVTSGPAPTSIVRKTISLPQSAFPRRALGVDGAGPASSASPKIGSIAEQRTSRTGTADSDELQEYKSSRSRANTGASEGGGRSGRSGRSSQGPDADDQRSEISDDRSEARSEAKAGSETSAEPREAKFAEEGAIEAGEGKLSDTRTRRRRETKLDGPEQPYGSEAKHGGRTPKRGRGGSSPSSGLVRAEAKGERFRGVRSSGAAAEDEDKWGHGDPHGALLGQSSVGRLPGSYKNPKTLKPMPQPIDFNERSF